MLEKGLGINAEALNKEKNVSYEREADRAYKQSTKARRKWPAC